MLFALLGGTNRAVRLLSTRNHDDDKESFDEVAVGLEKVSNWLTDMGYAEGECADSVPKHARVKSFKNSSAEKDWAPKEGYTEDSNTMFNWTEYEAEVGG
eukprot:TRINITY_DN108808_c0_g1_i1.p2 TRINITY_DN108808_c0_g1~~TRINITY_DN108808_c0_g1_i1.p2  ORF type:complete len:100 (+),score=15.18 TRINITY_DN108808_c0_g1_i1:130-429(+)